MYRLPSALYLCRKCGYKYFLFDDSTNDALRIAWFCMIDDHIHFCTNAAEISIDKRFLKGIQ